MVLDYPFVWPLWNAAENSQRQVCKQSLTLSESTTRDGLCSASDTPQEALRPTESWPETAFEEISIWHWNGVSGCHPCRWKEKRNQIIGL